MSDRATNGSSPLRPHGWRPHPQSLPPPPPAAACGRHLGNGPPGYPRPAHTARGYERVRRKAALQAGKEALVAAVGQRRRQRRRTCCCCWALAATRMERPLRDCGAVARPHARGAACGWLQAPLRVGAASGMVTSRPVALRLIAVVSVRASGCNAPGRGISCCC